MAVKNNNEYSAITPEVQRLADICAARTIPVELYDKFQVNRGLRDLNGNGVLAGLTSISQVKAKEIVNGVEVPAHGKLYYQGYDVEQLVAGFLHENRFGFEETVYLLLFGDLPTPEQLTSFRATLGEMRTLPPKFARDTIMRAPSRDMMNALSRAVLTLYYYDDNADDTSVPNVLRQCLRLIAQFPILAAYGYNTYLHYSQDQSLIIHQPDPALSTAENLLYVLRPDQQYTELEARVLDLALVLHAEHGGGNNSAFTIHVVGSSGTDTYSAVAAALGSLKGPKHGGANNRVMAMMDDLKDHVSQWDDEDEVTAYLKKLLHKEAFDKAGLIYGIGHAIYSLSDPRAVIFERFVEKLSADKGRSEEYDLYSMIARLAPQLISSERKMYKGVSANIDFYSGFVYDMMNLPRELYTPIFAIARIAGWSAHLIEEGVCGGRIIRPAYKSVSPLREYVPLEIR
ncbi:MAG: citrate/2-methylcitrate synthase [Oscillospiraceae bacterium]|jgi:citrate synthase|nr:citrate/2-methylcitrate synthase [Oscillospiraceae bacterium]